MKPEEARRRLEDAMAELRAQDAATIENRAPVELDQTSVGRLSRMDAIQGQAIAVAGRQRRAVELRRIKAALDRINTGEFGFCVGCGEEIEPRRLDLDLATATCTNCARG